MEKRVFAVSDEHIKLLRKAHVSWNDCDFGAPTVDPKRPYGDKNVLQDIAVIIGLKIFVDADGEKHLSEKQAKLCLKLHREMETVLEILLTNCRIEAGEYESDEYSHNWTRKTA